MPARVAGSTVMGAFVDEFDVANVGSVNIGGIGNDNRSANYGST